MQKPVKIMGVDPGSVVMGYSILQVQGDALELVTMDVLKLSGKDDGYQRLQAIYECIAGVIKIHKPQQFAIEAPFFGKNVQSMLKLGRAQGVAIAAAIAAGLPVAEYPPKRVKQSVTGNGNADKEQVYKMLAHLMPLGDAPKYFDASDALAVAVCHHLSSKLPGIAPKVRKAAKKGDWESFVTQNPGRLRQVP